MNIETATSKSAYIVPRRFFDDHILRELPPFDDTICDIRKGTIIKETKSTYTVMLTQDDVEELLDDAEYYSYPPVAREMMQGNKEMVGLIASARATVKRLQAQS